MFVKTTDGSVRKYPYTVGNLRRDNPQVSFPAVITDEMLAAWGVFPVVVQAQPEFDLRTQKAIPDIQPYFVDGVWKAGHVVVDNTPEEIAAYDLDAASGVRYQRDSLLSQTDWMALTDSTLSTVWASYRQALRDITAQVGFPHSVVWPTEPE